jgi:hypothetical protein
MRRTVIRYFNLAPRSAALQTGLVPQVELRLQWRVRNGQLMSHWCGQHPELGGGRPTGEPGRDRQ